jgi:hypothetical protein
VAKTQAYHTTKLIIAPKFLLCGPYVTDAKQVRLLLKILKILPAPKSAGFFSFDSKVSSF